MEFLLNFSSLNDVTCWINVFELSGIFVRCLHFYGDLLLPSVKEFHGIYYVLKIIRKKLNIGCYSVQNTNQSKEQVNTISSKFAESHTKVTWFVLNIKTYKITWPPYGFPQYKTISGGIFFGVNTNSKLYE